jgi:hypothetical protein
MRCVFCGHNEAKVRLANAEGGLVRLPVCRGDEVFIDESFGRPFTVVQLAGFQKELVCG